MTAPSKRCRRESPMLLKALMRRQHTRMLQEPETPWHLHRISISDLMAWREKLIVYALLFTKDLYSMIPNIFFPCLCFCFVFFSCAWKSVKCISQ